MIIIELDKEDIEWAKKLSDIAEDSIIVDEPYSFSSDLNSIVQVGITLAPTAISAAVLIIIELIKNKKHIRIKIGDFEVEGLSRSESIKLAEKYIEEKRDEKAKEELIRLLSTDSRK